MYHEGRFGWVFWWISCECEKSENRSKVFGRHHWKKEEKKKATLTLSSWKQEIKLPSEKYPPYNRRKEDILITGDREFGAKKSVQKYPVKLTLIFPVISSPFTTPGPNPSVLSIIHKFIVCKKVQSFLLWSVLQVFILLCRLPSTCKILIKLYAFLLLICLMPV